jgi:hypothetical protein
LRVFHENDFYEKIAQKIGPIFRRFFGDFLEKIVGHWQKIACLKKFRKPQGGGNDVFWCVEKGNFALLVLFKKVPTLVFNGKVKVTFSFIFHFHPFT